MIQCLRKITVTIIILALFSPFFSFAVSNDTGINVEVIEEEVKPLPLPAPLPGQDIIPPIIYNLFIGKITLNSATIEWETNELALCQLLWGRTSEYKEGIVSEITFSLSHKTELTDLLSGTNYHFKIKCQDDSKNESETKDQRFTTLTPPDITPPVNVSNFEAIPGDRQIELQWQNPPDPDFKAVRITRSEKFYPKDPWEGTLVYDGKGTSFVDIGLTNGKKYYYTAFSYDFAGNFSSGAAVSAVPRLEPPLPPEEIFTEKECLESGYYWYKDACHLEPELVPAPPEVEKLTLEDFDFWQEGRKISLIDGKIETKEKELLSVIINYDKVPEVLKTIMVTLEKEGKFFSFLLRINQEKTAYTATLLPPEDPGIYPVTIIVLDYKNQALKRIFGQLIVKGMEVPPLPIPWHKKYQLYIYIILLAILILAGIIYIYKKIKNKISKIKNKNVKV